MLWQPKDFILLTLVIALLLIILGDVLAPHFASLEHFKMLDEVVGATVAGILLVISNYFQNDKND